MAADDDRAMSARLKWDSRYADPGYEVPREPLLFLEQRARLLEPGRALCLAAGSGRNALHLAALGFDVTAMDISPVGLGVCELQAKERCLQIELVVADLCNYEPEGDAYDLITMLHYNDPSLFPAIRRSVRKGGHFLFETFSVDHKGHGWGPSDPAHLAQPGDLLDAFASWRLRYFEDGDEDAPDRAPDAKAAIVRLGAQRRG